MSHFGLLDFNGSIKKNRAQDAMLNSLNGRDAFLKQLEDERRLREEGGKQKRAACIIQRFWKGTMNKRKARKHFRMVFDACSSDSLEVQIRRISFFFDNSQEDCERLTKLCTQIIQLQDVPQLSMDVRLSFARRALLPFIRTSSPSSNLNSVIRFFQLTTAPHEWIRIVQSGFFPSCLSMFVSRCSSLSPSQEEFHLPLHLQSLFQFILLPFSYPLSKVSVTAYLLSSLSSISHPPSICTLGLLFVPSLSQFLSDLSLVCDSVHPSLNGSVAFTPHSPLVFHLLLLVISSCPSPPPPLSSTLSTLLSLFTPLSSSFSSLSPLHQSLLCHHISSPSIVLFISSSPISDSFISCLCSLECLSPPFSSCLLSLSSSPSFIRRVWSYVSVVSYSSSPSLPLLSKGVLPDRKECRLSLSLSISLFSRLFAHLIQHCNDELLDVKSWNLVFTYEETKYILSLMRDVALSLVNIVYPEERMTEVDNRKEIATECSHMFSKVVALLQVAHAKDQRLLFLPTDFWSNHKKQVNLNRRTLTVHRISRHGRRRNDAGTTYTFLHHLLDSMSDSDSDDDEYKRERDSAMSVGDRRSTVIMKGIPFVVPFMQRVSVLKELIEEDKSSMPGLIDVSVRRSHLYEDAFSDLSHRNAPTIRPPLRVSMHNWAGLSEAGIDGGGIFREFISELIRQALDMNRGLFTETADHLVYPNPIAHLVYPDYKDHFFFVGRILGKAIYEGLLLDVRFADFFLSQLFSSARKDVDLIQMRSIDPIVYNNLVELKDMDAEKVDELLLDFSVLVEEMGRTRKVDLIPNGSSIRVTALNRSEYVQLYANYFLIVRIEDFVSSMRLGVCDVVDIRWLSIFSSREMQLVVSGEEGDIDMDDLQQHIVLHWSRPIEQDDEYMSMLWSVLRSFPSEERRCFVKFVTGCSRPPLGGFASLHPQIGIQIVHNVDDRLPTSATCMNLLKLPRYKDRATLEERLRYAINAGAGFELS